MKPHYKFIVWANLIISVGIITFFTGAQIRFWSQIDVMSKLNVVGSILEGTLALGALSLAVLAYSFSEIHLRTTTVEKAPYRRLALIAYFATPASLTDAVVSATFILTQVPFSFELSLVLLYATIVGLIVLVTLWIMEEL